MPHSIRFALAGLLSLLLASSAFAAVELKGVKFPDQETVGGKTLELNGVGLRQATFLKIDVYVAGLYVERKSTDAGAILHAPGPKRLTMTFLRDVSAEKIRGAWAEGYSDNCKPNCEKVKPAIDKLNAMMVDVKKTDSMVVTFPNDDQAVLEVGGKKLGEVAQPGVTPALLAIWLGEHPPTEDLRDGLLGKRK